MVYASRWQEQQIDAMRPTLAEFQNTIHLSTRLQGDTHHKGGVRYLIDGRELACGVSYMGTTHSCRQVFHSLDIGTPLTVDVALIRCGSGERWLARTITLSDGSSYATTPEKMMRNWELDSRSLIPEINFLIAAVFFGLPLVFVFVFWLASRLPLVEPQTAKVRIIDGNKSRG
jgi:hypothetical protein